jgi:hypothetical protein
MSETVLITVSGIAFSVIVNAKCACKRVIYFVFFNFKFVTHPRRQKSESTSSSGVHVVKDLPSVVDTILSMIAP